jgi:hypothetical protein
MSAFIGPIHYWLYGKIRLVNQRQEYLREKVSEMCGSTAEELWEQVTQSYGELLPEKDLSELIAHDNIHGWLQRQINLAESREAAFIKELTDTCGGAAQDLIGRAFVEHGKNTGEAAAASGRYDLESAAGILKALSDHYLNGMPCDAGDCVMSLHLANWQRTGVNEADMRSYYEQWLKGFVQGANAKFVYKLDGESHQISPSA